MRTSVFLNLFNSSNLNFSFFNVPLLLILREIFSFFLHDKSGRKIAIELSVVTLCNGASSNLVYARPSPVSFSLSCILRLSRTTFFIWRRLFPRLHVFQQFQNRFPPDFYAPSCRHLSLISWRKKKKKEEKRTNIPLN